MFINITKTYIILQFLHPLAVKHKYIFITSNIMTFHLIFILRFITYLMRKKDKTLENEEE